ncbi:hypothetical protein [Chitinophaga hostae]|uniref:Glycosyltransferase involved in LPS biosynthesis, GR25 family n=1 Tax=Chitinophaga hostae TaxID=2831022 RepID=A0ABS5IZ23_9BACT|nr:hypothetical protein [Chitinophaga hostae]MBS0028140.1 hypothetical protein [Chitinophaga hostae]
MKSISIPTYIINLKNRSDRRAHILQEFEGRDEFNATIIDAHRHEIGSIGLWNTIKVIVTQALEQEHDYILICEDDHLFTAAYSKETLQLAISEAISFDADILSGGVSWHGDGVAISDTLFWVKKFSGTQFIIVFKKFFQPILNAAFTPADTADTKITDCSDRVYFIHPFISVQKEFGYSDATDKNNGTDRVEQLFTQSAAGAEINRSIRSFYKTPLAPESVSDEQEEEDATIPVYIMNLPERTERREHILQQFEGRLEFDVTLVNACKHEIGAFGHWQSIQKIIQLAINNDDDVIIICEDDHEFTPAYSREILFKSIYTAYQQGCDYCSGGAGKFDIAVPITNNLFWTNHCLSTQFIIVFRKFFQKILDAKFDETIIGDIILSEMTGNKMIIFPYISTQKDFGYSDITAFHNSVEGIVQFMFAVSEDRLITMNKIFVSHHNQLKNMLSDTAATVLVK